MKHDFRLDSDGKPDDFTLDIDGHNGYECLRCEDYFCRWCHPNVLDEECEVDQPSLLDQVILDRLQLEKGVRPVTNTLRRA